MLKHWANRRLHTLQRRLDVEGRREGRISSTGCFCNESQINSMNHLEATPSTPHYNPSAQSLEPVEGLSTHTGREHELSPVRCALDAGLVSFGYQWEHMLVQERNNIQPRRRGGRVEHRATEKSSAVESID